MGNKIDPRCKNIYNEYLECYNEWKKQTDWRQYYHEGHNEECNELLMEFHYCSKEQMARITGYVPADELMKMRDEVKIKQQNEKNAKNKNLTQTTPPKYDSSVKSDTT